MQVGKQKSTVQVVRKEGGEEFMKLPILELQASEDTLGSQQNQGDNSTTSASSSTGRRTKSMGGSQDCEFPLFRQKFWGLAAWTETYGVNVAQSSSQYLEQSFSEQSADSIAALRGQARGRPPMFYIDLANITREDSGPLTEVRARQIKMEKYKNVCSQVSQNIFISAECVARDKEVLRNNGITHVINCVGYEFPNPFPDIVQYLTLYLYDSLQEDIKCVLYDCFDFIEDARSKEGGVLVHCSQGVSRSVAVVIGYLMWKLDRSHQDVFKDIKDIRGVANPNVGFLTQLVQLQKKQKQPVDPGFCRAYRLAPHCPADALRLVPRPINPQNQGYSYIQIELSDLDSRIACVFHCHEHLYIWQGSDATEEFVLAAMKFAGQLLKYEQTTNDFVRVFQGLEPAELKKAVRGVEAGQGQGLVGGDDPQNYIYDDEFEWYAQAKLQQAQELYVGRDTITSKENQNFGSMYESQQKRSRKPRRGGSSISRLSIKGGSDPLSP